MRPDLYRNRSMELVALPLVEEISWERVAREFDDIGPEACVAETLDELLERNPHCLEIACRCAADAGDLQRVFTGFAMFYRILAAQAADHGTTLPCVTAETREVMAELAAELGEPAFVLLATEALCEDNPCLAQMADGFASRHAAYDTIMHGFALIYRCLSAQAAIESLARARGPRARQARRRP